ncbi:T9SS type A sorting domain-containing protein [Ancylomarina longa]|uniref:T9SS C-terminal target domain-containing protein n=1 Tax=Ancylomarina longa TaxID=2487017 RepID=A0A434AYM2_9BACT|nr:T9SS type A sorting domain-containing protein [Ancylomarina longa]RUT79668.1 T9SS C-terminal target domain-containing protein [Ancylomarina longa]
MARADRGNFIRFAVTPVAQTGELLQGQKVYSAYSDEIAYSTGIDDVLNQQLRFYPNPVRDILYLENLNQVKQIQLFDLSGRAVLAVQTPNNSVNLNMNALKNGMYILVFELEDGSRLSKKILKQ